ncbi:MAG: hypothetical protein QOE45_3468 [Frankiaceae bacterium]|jgi:hypothetical protein|nr:hypothetical protein [Frankiaceae bacterium]
MLILVSFLLAAALVPLARGRLSALADFRPRHAWAIGAAAVVQVLALAVFRNAPHGLVVAGHLASYGLAGLFLVANRKVQGLWLICTGAAMNVFVIVTNDGRMPATREALAAAGRLSHSAGFVNSGIVAHPKYLVFGDVFALPVPFPLHNVFSAGDVLIVIGAAAVVHQLCASRLIPSTWRGPASADPGLTR